VDTVHQGDWECEKGVYHINAVDAVTQWEIVGCTPRISEQHLLPVLEAMLHQFPFCILGFHAYNGSEFVNHTVAKRLHKLLVEFTRSRPNRSSDNALVEGKNGAIIRKHIGYGHIASQHADQIQRFYMAHFNPYLNYHRPCGFAQVRLDERGRRRRHYRKEDYVTPYALPDAHRHLKDGIRWELLDRLPYAHSDTEAARRMMRAKAELLRQCKLESSFPAELRMLTPRKGSAVPSRAKGPQTPAPSPCIPSPARRGFSEKKSTGSGWTQFQDHLVLETIPDFRIILELEYALLCELQCPPPGAAFGSTQHLWPCRKRRNVRIGLDLRLGGVHQLCLPQILSAAGRGRHFVNQRLIDASSGI
jgi:hypothetical protein